jgi:hypothetical protein
MNNIKILENGMIKVMGDYRNFYNADNDSIDNTCPVSFENCELLEIDEECMILEPESKNWEVTIDGIIYGKEDFMNYEEYMKQLIEMGKQLIELGCDDFCGYDEIYLQELDKFQFDRINNNERQSPYCFLYGIKRDEDGEMVANDVLSHIAIPCENLLTELVEIQQDL